MAAPTCHSFLAHARKADHRSEPEMMKPALLAFALLLLASAAHAASGKLVLYTSQPGKTVAAFTRKEPGVSLEIFRSGTTEVMNRLQAELLAGDPRPDVLFIADALTMEELKADHRLMAYPGADVVAFPADAYDKDFTYFGSKLITTGII